MGPPDRYLGANIEKAQNENDSVMWATHSADYCKADIANMYKTQNTYGKLLSQYGGVRCPYPPIFHP